MMIIVEANIVFQALIKRGFIFRLIKQLSKAGIKLHSPEFILDEVRSREERLLKYSGLTKIELEFLIRVLFSKIEIVPLPKYSRFVPEALSIFPGHIKDAPYFALALSSFGYVLWSDEKRHKKQPKVKVCSTSELLKELGLKK